MLINTDDAYLCQNALIHVCVCPAIFCLIYYTFKGALCSFGEYIVIRIERASLIDLFKPKQAK